MLYRENGQFKTSYQSDQQIFPIAQDRIFIALLLVVAFVVVPGMASDTMFSPILTPFLNLAPPAPGGNPLCGHGGRDPEGLGRAADVDSIEALEKNATVDESKMVRLASAFALQKLGRSYAGRLIDLMSSVKVLSQGQEYLIELGPAMVSAVARV